uniref:Chitin-binding type-4 domain-containing protein n=1 Tax=Biomphalaria glabrata TaxID=6526 RepID=A0A2C9LE15_BIOGL
MADTIFEHEVTPRQMAYINDGNVLFNVNSWWIFRCMVFFSSLSFLFKQVDCTRMLARLILVLLTIFVFNVISINAHGRLLEPPSRMSAWRFGYPVPRNYDDHSMNCGGYATQWNKNGGKCGICGDSWSGTRFYERPNGAMVQHKVIPMTYSEGSTMKVTLDITVSHNVVLGLRRSRLTSFHGYDAVYDGSVREGFALIEERLSRFEAEDPNME